MSMTYIFNQVWESCQCIPVMHDTISTPDRISKSIKYRNRTKKGLSFFLIPQELL